MAYTVDWFARNIFIPASDLILESAPANYILQMDSFKREIRRLEWEFDEGLAFPQILRRNLPENLSGVTYAALDVVDPIYSITFDPAIDRVTTSGSNNNIADVMVFNGVSLVTNNSAGLTYSAEVENQIYQIDGVVIDTINGEDDSFYPLGSKQRPVRSLANAQALIASRGLAPKIFILEGDVTVGPGDNIDKYDIDAEQFAVSSLTIQNGASANNVKIKNCTISNSFLGDTSTYENCLLLNCTNLRGLADDCQINGPTVITGDTFIRRGFGSPIIVPSGSGISINLVAFSGFPALFNSVAPNAISIGLQEGLFTVDSSCTDGTINLSLASGALDDNQSDLTLNIISQDQRTQGGLAQIPPAVVAAYFATENEPGETMTQFYQRLRAAVYGNVSRDAAGVETAFRADGTTPALTLVTTGDNDEPGTRTVTTN